MGNDHPQPKKGQTTFNKNIDKSKLDILIKQIYFTAQLQKDRKKGQQNAKEKELLAFIREPVNKRNKDNEYSKASSAVNDAKSIKAHELVMRYADILKDNEMVIQLSKGDTTKIMDLVPYVESIIWGCQKCNVECIKQFEEFIIANFGLETYNQILQFTKVTPELKSQFSSVIPSEKEVKLYLIDFCNRHGINLDVLNEVGHSLSPTELADLPDPDSKPSINQNPNPNNAGGFPGNQGGFPGNQGGYPSGQGQGGQFPNYNPQQQGGYPPYGGQQQGGYPPYGGGYPGNQGGYPQQGGFPQQQGGYPQQQGGNYPGFGGYSQQAPHGYQPGGYPQGGPGGPGGYGAPNSGPSGYGGPSGGQGQSYQPPVSQNPTVEINVGFSGNANQQPGGEAYPNFQKFTGGPQGGKSNDPLDELDLRLKNIKDGL
jgi:hypothetical protein